MDETVVIMVSNHFLHHAAKGQITPISILTYCVTCVVDLSSLRLTGQSAMPVDNEKDVQSRSKKRWEANAKRIDTKAFEDQRVFVRKERQGFGGGFKILEEYRRNKLKRKGDNR